MCLSYSGVPGMLASFDFDSWKLSLEASVLLVGLFWQFDSLIQSVDYASRVCNIVCRIRQFWFF